VKTTIVRAFAALLVLFPLVAGCAPTDGSTDGASATVALSVHWPTTAAARAIPASTDHIVIAVTAAGMTTVSVTIDQADVVGDFAQVRFGVPAGSARHFHVEAQSAADAVLAQGDADADLVAGQTTRLVVELL